MRFIQQNGPVSARRLCNGGTYKLPYLPSHNNGKILCTCQMSCSSSLLLFRGITHTRIVGGSDLQEAWVTHACLSCPWQNWGSLVLMMRSLHSIACDHVVQQQQPMPVCRTALLNSMVAGGPKQPRMAILKPFQINLLFLGPNRPTILTDRVDKTKNCMIKSYGP